MKANRNFQTLRHFLCAATALLSLSAATTASAILWVDRDPDSGNGPLKFLTESGNSSNRTYSSTFDISGYANFSDYNILSFEVTFAFADDSDNGFEHVDITLGQNENGSLTTIWDDREVDGSHADAPNSYDWLSPLSFSSGALLLDLQADGILNYSVTIQSKDSWRVEDAYLKIAQLTAKAERKPVTTNTPVPDGGATLGLLGLGLMGLGALRRKLR
jgi:VPDSG-CTERM motif